MLKKALKRDENHPKLKKKKRAQGNSFSRVHEIFAPLRQKN